MPRVETILGEMTQQPVGTVLGSRGAYDASRSPQGAAAQRAGLHTSKLAFQRTCCKTCDGVRCVGRCKF